VHPAAAQSCHAPSSALAGDGPSASLSLREATVDAAGLEADYQGVMLGIAYAFDPAIPLEASAVLPAYRLDAGGPVQTGLGDVLVDLRATLLSSQHEHRDHRDQLQAGLEVAATLPTARSGTGLGMGHVMLMPGLFLRVHDAALALLWQAGYGRALASEGHSGHSAGHATAHAHAGAALGAVVDPMNASEVETALTLSVRVLSQLSVLGSLAAAVPVATEGGRVRAAVGGGVSTQLDPVTLALQVEVPLAGDPFEQRATLTASISP
jgi:hypothetical protein